MSDTRDSNHDGKVSFMEKIKHKLHHKSSKDKDAVDYTTIHTQQPVQPCNCPTCLESVGFPPAQSQAYINGGYFNGQQQQSSQFASYPNGSYNGGYPSGTNPAGAVPLTGVAPQIGAVPFSGTGTAYPRDNYNSGAIPQTTYAAETFDRRDANRDGYMSAGAPGSYNIGTHPHGAYNDSSHYSSGAYDSRDLNHDGRVSGGEKVVATVGYPHKHSGGFHDHAAHNRGATGTYPQMGGYDARDTNRDGHVSMGEKLGTSGSYQGFGAHDSRDVNHDGRVSLGEKLASHPQSGMGAYDARDMNQDGRVSLGEKLASSHPHGGVGAYDSRETHHIGSNEETTLRLHEEQLAVSKRQVSAGVVGLSKRVQAERVQHRVPVKREELIVERRPLTGVTDHVAGIPSPDEISRVTIYREDIVTHKRLVPTEEIIVRKQIVTEQQPVGATLRSEHVEASQSGTAHLPNPIIAGGAYDARDTNLDGHLSAGERLHATGGGQVHDVRDTNRDGYVSMGEKLHGAVPGGHHQFGSSEELRLRLHEEQLAVSKREVPAGEVNIYKHIQEERVEQLVPVSREELVVERRSLAGIVDHKPGVAGPDEVSRVTLYREEIVIEKHLVPIEEVIVRKRVVTDYQTVDAVLRYEYFQTTQLSGGYDTRDVNHDGRVSASEELGSAMGASAAPGGVYDARDSNRDGHVSMGEKLKGAAVGTSSGPYDARDSNYDGHVSMGEKLKASTDRTGFYDANSNGQMYAGDKLNRAYDVRDTNLDGHVSAGEKIASEPHFKAARG